MPHQVTILSCPPRQVAQTAQSTTTYNITAACAAFYDTDGGRKMTLAKSVEGGPPLQVQAPKRWGCPHPSPVVRMH